MDDQSNAFRSVVEFFHFNRGPVRWLRFWIPAERETWRMGRTVLMCALVGVVVGLFAVWFFSMIEWIRVFTLESFGHNMAPLSAGEPPIAEPLEIHYTLLDRIHPKAAAIFSGFICFVLPAIGALLAGWFTRKFAPSAAGHGTDTVIGAYHHTATKMPPSVAPVKVIASSLVIGSGGSAGAEGPITQIGAVCGTTIARLLRLSPYEQRILLSAGMAAGIGAIFRSPMAGALFASEVLYRGFDLEGDVLIPSMVASTISYMTYACFIGWQPVFNTPNEFFDSPLKFACYAALAFIIAAAVRFNILFFRQTEIVFHRMRLPIWAKPAIGGLLVGAIGLCFPQILSSGYGYIQQTLQDNTQVLTSEHFAQFGVHVALLLFLLGIVKAISTAFTVGSGGSGGLLGPSLFSGAMYGASVGVFFNWCFPNLGISIANFAMVGMVGYLTAAVRTPLAAILMVSEFTGNHNLLLPAMWVCGLAFLLTPGWTLYHSQVRDRDSSPAHLLRHGGLKHDCAVRVKRNSHKRKAKSKSK